MRAPSARPSSHSVSQPASQPASPAQHTSTHQICLPAWPSLRFRFFCAPAVGSTQHTRQTKPAVSDALLSVLPAAGCRLSTLKFSVLSQGFREPRAPRGQTEPRVVFGTQSSLPACLSPAGSFLRGAHHISRPDLFRTPLPRPRHHALRDTCPLAKTIKTPDHHRPARFLPGFAAKAISRALPIRATSSRCVPRLRRACVRGTH